MQAFQEFIKNLKKELNHELPGVGAQLLMAPEFRKETLKIQSGLRHAKKSAVLVLLYPYKNSYCTVFIKRNTYNGVHSGQISFPGGQKELNDNDLIATALREANEEIGVNPSEIEVIGNLSEIYIPPSNFNVLPVIGITNRSPMLTADTNEVTKIIRVRLNDLLDDKNIKQDIMWSSENRNIKAPYYSVESEKIWGATAMILSELLVIIRKINMAL